MLSMPFSRGLTSSGWSGCLGRAPKGVGVDLLRVDDHRQLREVLGLNIHLAPLACRKLEGHRCFPRDILEDQIMFLVLVIDTLNGPEDTSTMFLLVDALGGCDDLPLPAIEGHVLAFWMF